MEVPRPSVEIHTQRVDKDRIGVGMIGAGSFAVSVLLPALKTAGGSENVAIASAGGMTAQRVGAQHGFRTATASSNEIIEHDDVDAVFVLTRHGLHAPLIVQALEAGKSVFSEKPLALSLDELADIERARAESRGDVMVGFNRRFAPLVLQIAQHYEGRTHPLVMHYRVNAGFIASDHWVHDPIEGGGRIMGECCHFIDVLQFLARAKPVRVFAESIAGDSRYRGECPARSTRGGDAGGCYG